MIKVDICIIGASIAGNYLSSLLTKTQLRIAIIEEHKEVGRPFQCAGIVSMKLERLIEVPQEIILNRVHTAKLFFPPNTSVELAGDERPYVIDRVKLDRLFYKKAASHDNIRFFLGEKFKSFSYVSNEESVLIQTSKRQIKAKLLIGCDGPLSYVANQLGVINNIIYATQIRIKGNFNGEKVYMYFDEQWNDLFGWIVPEGKGVYRIGLGTKKGLMRKFKEFLQKIRVSYEHRIDQQGGMIPIGPIKEMAFDNVMLLGDSASMVKATTGGGIIMLLIAARQAAQCINKCFQTSDFSKRFIKKHYEDPTLARVGRQLKIHHIIRYVLRHFSNDEFRAFYRVINRDEVKKIISVYGDMDFPLSLAIKLLGNPSFIRFLFRFILKKPIVALKTVLSLIN